MGKNNRRLGVITETSIIKIWSTFLGLTSYHVKHNKDDWQMASTRAVSKVRDDDGVDIVFRNCVDKLKRLAVQIKRTVIRTDSTTKIDIAPLQRIMELDEDTDPVLVTRVYQKVGKSNRCQGDFVTIPMDYFLKLLKDHANNSPR